MDFYIYRVLFPAISIDIALTVSFLRKENILRGRRERVICAFGTSPLYLIAALVWIFILGVGDSRFQGQGVLGLILLWGLGIVFAVLRLLLGLILFFSLKHR
jgi:hypothetical protein